MLPKLEIACFNLESAIIAEQAGADRIELCRHYDLGGLTPSELDIAEATKKIKIPIFVMIRCKADSFVYSLNEIEQMKQSIAFCKKHAVAGFVFGALTKFGEVDVFACKELIDAANPLPVTFHRAIDECIEIEASIRTIITLGFKRILSSGKANSAIEGIHQLKSWQKKFGQQIIFLPGGSVRSSNIVQLMQNTACSEFHSAAVTNDSGNCDATEIKKIKQLILQHA